MDNQEQVPFQVTGSTYDNSSAWPLWAHKATYLPRSMPERIWWITHGSTKTMYCKTQTSVVKVANGDYIGKDKDGYLYVIREADYVAPKGD